MPRTVFGPEAFRAGVSVENLAALGGGDDFVCVGDEDGDTSGEVAQRGGVVPLVAEEEAHRQERIMMRRNAAQAGEGRDQEEAGDAMRVAGGERAGGAAAKRFAEEEDRTRIGGEGVEAFGGGFDEGGFADLARAGAVTGIFEDQDFPRSAVVKFAEAGEVVFAVQRVAGVAMEDDEPIRRRRAGAMRGFPADERPAGIAPGFGAGAAGLREQRGFRFAKRMVDDKTLEQAEEHAEQKIANRDGAQEAEEFRLHHGAHRQDRTRGVSSTPTAPLMPSITARFFPLLILLSASAGALAQEVARPPEAVYEKRAAHDPNGIGVFYMGREIAFVMGHQAADWLERPERDAEERTDLLVEALKFQPGEVVADIGCGSGFIARKIAKKITPGGFVYGVDIQEEMLDLLARRMAMFRIDNVKPLLGTPSDPKVPAASCDTMIMVDVYHEFDQPYEMTRSMIAGLKPGGRLVFVEYRKEDPKVPIKEVHKMSEAQIKREMAIHSEMEHAETIGVLPRQHIVIFKKK